MKTETAQHTRTPWTVVNAPNFSDVRESETHLNSILTIWTQTHKEDAAFIVRAVNAHEELLDIAKKYRREMSEAYNAKELLEVLDAVIVKAQAQ